MLRSASLSWNCNESHGARRKSGEDVGEACEQNILSVMVCVRPWGEGRMQVKETRPGGGGGN